MASIRRLSVKLSLRRAQIGDVGAPSELNLSENITLYDTGRQPLSSVSAISDIISAIPSGATIAVTAPSDSYWECAYAPAPDVVEILPTSGREGVTPTWNGTVDSGYASWLEEGAVRSAFPAADTRTDGKPGLYLMTYPRQRLTGEFEFLVGVECITSETDPALNGCSKVRMYVEGAFVDSTSYGIAPMQDVHGRWFFAECFKFKINAATWRAAKSGGAGDGWINCAWRAYPKNTTLETQLIGRTGTGANAATVNWYRFYLSDREYTHRIEINPNLATDSEFPNGTWPNTYARFKYQKDALIWGSQNATYLGVTGITNAGDQCPLFIHTASGTHDIPSGSTAIGRGFAQGYPTITTEPGVSVEWKRASYNPAEPNGGPTVWRPNIWGMRFQGNIYWNGENGGFQYTQGTGNQLCVAWDGIRVGSDTSWHTTPFYDKKIWQFTIPHYMVNCVTKYVAGCPHVSHNNVFEYTTGDMFNGTVGAQNTWVKRYGYFENHGTSTGGLRITYTGGGVPGFSKTGTTGSTGTGDRISLLVGGVAVWTSSTYPNNYADLAAVVAEYNSAPHADFTMIVHPDATGNFDRHPIYLESVSNAAFTGGVYNAATRVDQHQDVIQFRSSSRDNLTVKNFIGTGQYVQSMKQDAQTTLLITQDFQAANWVFGNTPLGLIGSFGGENHLHIGMVHIADAGSTMNHNGSTGRFPDQWSFLANCTYATINWTGTQRAYPKQHNIHSISGVAASSGQTLTGSNSSGGSVSTIYPNLEVDYRMNEGSTITNNLVAPLIPYDCIGATYQTLDAKSGKACRLTSRNITKADLETMALWTLFAPETADAGDLVLSWENDEAQTVNLTVNVAIQPLSIAA